MRLSDRVASEAAKHRVEAVATQRCVQHFSRHPPVADMAARRWLSEARGAAFAQFGAQHRNLRNRRGRACPKLNPMRNRLPPLLLHLQTPALQLGNEEGDLSVLLDALCPEAAGVVVTKQGVWQLLN